MSDSQISVELSANIANFRANLAAAVTELNRTGNQAQTASNQITQNIQRVNSINLRSFNSSLQAGTISLSNIGAASTAMSTTATRSLAAVAAASANSGRAITAGSNQATMALTNLGRVAQDSSFGFIGIANNLNPLLESFQRLRAESGSNVGALRALGSSLMGAGGLGLALSVVQAAVLFSQMGLRAWTGTVKNAKEAAKDYIDGLDALSQAQLKGSQNAQKELAELKTLYAVSTDTTISLEKRKDAVNELQEKYPKYLGNIKDEAILAGDAGKAYDSLTKSILASAKARAAQDLVAKKASALLLNEEQIANAEAGIKQNKKSEAFRIGVNERSLRDAKKLSDAQGEALQTESAQASILATKQKYGEANARQEEYINIRKQANLKLTQDILNLEKFTTQEVKKGADLTNENSDASGKKLKSLAEILKELQQSLLLNDNQFHSTFGDRNKGAVTAYQSAIESLINNGYKPLSAEVLKLKKEQQDLFQLPFIQTPSVNTGIEEPKNTSKVSGKKSTDLFANYTEIQRQQAEGNAKIYAAQDKFNEDFNSIIQSGIVNGLSDLGSAIGNALANGGNVLEAAGKSLLSSFGDIIVNLGKMMIQMGISLKIAKESLKSLNPVIAIAAGVALVTIGSVFKSKASALGGGSGSSKSDTPTSRSIPAFASGVDNFKGGMALVGEQGPELINLPTGSSVIPNGRTERMMSRSDTHINLNGELSINLETLYFRMKSVEKKLGRLG